MSKSPSRQPALLQGKLKLMEKKKKKVYIFVSFYDTHIFQYSKVLATSRFQWLI